MSVLSVFKCLRFEVKYLIPIVFVIGLLFKNVSSNSPAADGDTDSSKLQKLPFCDENLIAERDVSKR